MEELIEELTCAICTDILYQPLTLLDCLHTFCGSCLKEWFAWQAASAAQSRRRTAPYTCPSCRDSVRGTKVDWRANTLLEGFLKVHPDKAKSEEDKEEMRKLYTPGDDVLKPVHQPIIEHDSEDERLLADVRDLSMAYVDPATGRRRAERSDRHRRRQDRAHTPEQLRRRQEQTPWEAQRARLTESRLRQHDGDEPQIEHQPSLRSLLSASEASTPDVQAEILQQIYAEGVLDGIDLDNLTTEQEEELTDRIAEAYRRRQQPGDRANNRERRQRDDRSRHPVPSENEQTSTQQDPLDAAGAQQQPRSRPPISRPHLFEQNLQEPVRDQQRSASATNQRSSHSRLRSDGTSPASRSATDLSLQQSTNNTQRDRRRRLSGTGRRTTDPENGGMREQMHRYRAEANHSGQRRPQDSLVQRPQTSPRQNPARNNSTASLPISSPPPTVAPEQTIHAAVSTAAFAPEPVSIAAHPQSAPSIRCNRCEKPGIQYDLHYNCPTCLGGHFNLCLHCYRNQQGCNYWFGYGFRAFDRWYRNAPPEGWPHGNERPHVLSSRRYTRYHGTADTSKDTEQLREGPFCESCFAFANDCYWYCDICLDGAWGFCDKCVHQGKHCTHPVLLVAHLSTLQHPHYDPTKVAFVDLPHLRPQSYVTLPPTTHCDICHRPIPPNSTRFHCYQCSEGDYDMCNECYRGLVMQGKISQGSGPDGWRRCLQGHRMAVIGYQDRIEGGHVRRTVSEPVGGWDFKEDEGSRGGQIPSSGLPPAGGVGMRCLAVYNYFPNGDVTDELAFPKNAEIREAKSLNGEWYSGVYAGAVNLFPSNHVRTL
ncbi:hypothetical protein LTR37_005314 [Vermiconidia calcicola]|uniref:Uncharacterized protein n=1 Tax=Vermiconidia calcicola TaxID=1690605 RepID=A0ACC3NLD6_9PEZI|nr:hypothetical protein LTR37_005314 [Vermiconidia calcicola]